MSLEPYKRGSTYWARGRIEYNTLPITPYFREATGAASEAGARRWIAEREEAEIRRHLVGDRQALTFIDVLDLYEPTPTMAKYLIPLAEIFAETFVADIMPETVRALGPRLYPNASTDTWRRWVITPVRAVINNGHDKLGSRCPPIKIKGYSKKERVDQDKARGKKSRQKKTPGSWEWLLKFRETAGPYHGALYHLMFVTGARISQAVAMRPEHLDLQNARVTIPGAKGHDDRVVEISMELVVELANLPPKCPRGWQRTAANKRIFGFAGKDGPRKGSMTACRKAGIEYLPPHSAGRHGFGQELRVRQGVDKQAVGSVGAWDDLELLEKTYTHEEDSGAKVKEAFRTGRVQAEKATGLKLLKKGLN